MKCSLCGFDFEKDESEKACAGCPFSNGCEMRKCPNCGFEMPEESERFKSIFSYLSRVLGIKKDVKQ